MLYALPYAIIRRVLRLGGISSDAEAEVLVLRHELAVLRRQVKRAKLRRRDKLFLTAMSRVLPRERWAAFILTPATLVRWHRELVRRKWTYPASACTGPPAHRLRHQALIVRMATENPRWGCVRIKGELQGLDLMLRHDDPNDPPSGRPRASRWQDGSRRRPRPGLMVTVSRRERLDGLIHVSGPLKGAFIRIQPLTWAWSTIRYHPGRFANPAGCRYRIPAHRGGRNLSTLRSTLTGHPRALERGP